MRSRAMIAKDWGFLDRVVWFYGDQEQEIKVSEVANDPVTARMNLKRMGVDLTDLELRATPYNSGLMFYRMMMQELHGPGWVREYVKGEVLS